MQAVLGEQLPPHGVRQAHQQVAAGLRRVEQVQLDRDAADQSVGRAEDMHAGLQQPEAGATATDRNDLPVHDHRDAHRSASTPSSG